MVIKVLKMLEVDIVIKIPDNIPPVIVDQELLLKGEVDISLIPATLPPITQVTIVGFLIFPCPINNFLTVVG